jgi:4-aminobutyrate aminotransferase
VARQFTKKQNVIVFQVFLFLPALTCKGSYHGRTYGSMALTTSKTVYKVGFGPFMPGVFVSSFPECSNCPTKCGSGCCNRWIDDLEIVLKTQTPPSDTAAILVEPVQGEGGYAFPPESFLRDLRKLCDKHGILLIMDEVQTGFGRTGDWFMSPALGVIPDILVMAKGLLSFSCFLMARGLGSGVPISCIATKDNLMANMAVGSMGLLIPHIDLTRKAALTVPTP